MALITKPDMEFIWASGGAIVEPSDVKKQTGWTPEVPPHQWENWVQNRQDKYLAHINQRGIPEWDGNTEYEAAGLSYVQGSNGTVYKSVAASGPATTVQDPTTDVTDTYWTVAFAAVGAFITEADGDLRYAQRANNLSDLTSTSTARTNLGVADSVAAGITASHSNLKVSSTGTNAVVTLTAGSVCIKDSSNSQVVLNTVSVTPSLATSGANGLDTGTSAINTWYSVWVIWNGTTAAGLLSTSATAPTLPSGYTHKARVGWVRSDSNASNKFPLSFVQADNEVQYKIAAGSNVTSMIGVASGVSGSPTTPTYTSIAVGSFVPPTAGAVTISVINPTGTSSVIVAAPNASYGAYNSTTNPPPVGVSSQSGFIPSPTQAKFLLESTNIFFASNSAAGGVFISGWSDNL